MPMGFTWAVVLAHDAMRNIIKTAYNIASTSLHRPAHHAPIKFMSKQDAPFNLLEVSALALAIIDDISILLCSWPDKQIKLLHRTLLTLLIAAGLPIAEAKSLPEDSIEEEAVPFIGMTLKLRTKLVTPMTTRIAKLATFIRSNSFDAIVTYTVWTSLVGKLVSYAMLHRGILAHFDTVYRHTPRIYLNSTMPANVRYTISDQQKDEVKRIISLLPLAQVRLSLPIHNILIAFDASYTAAAAVYTHLESHEALNLWTKATKRAATKDTTPKTDLELEQLVARKSWRIAAHHPWKQSKRKLPHINALEAIAANIAMDWISRQIRQPTRIIILTDSAVVLGAYNKGRSSIPWLLDKIRRYHSITLSTGLSTILTHIRSKHNPADPPSRKTSLKSASTK